MNFIISPLEYFALALSQCKKFNTSDVECKAINPKDNWFEVGNESIEFDVSRGSDNEFYIAKTDSTLFNCKEYIFIFPDIATYALNIVESKGNLENFKEDILKKELEIWADKAKLLSQIILTHRSNVTLIIGCEYYVESILITGEKPLEGKNTYEYFKELSICKLLDLYPNLIELNSKLKATADFSKERELELSGFVKKIINENNERLSREKKLSDFEVANEQLNSELQHTFLKLNDKSKELNEIKGDFKIANLLLDQAQEEIDSLIFNNNKNEKIIENRNSEMLLINQSNDDLQKKVSNLEALITENSKRYHDDVKELQDNLNSLKYENSIKEKRFEIISDDNQSFKSEINELKVKLELSREEYAAVNEHLEILSLDNHNLKNELDELENNLESSREEARNRENLIENLKTKLNIISLEKDELQRDIEENIVLKNKAPKVLEPSPSMLKIIDSYLSDRANVK